MSQIDGLNNIVEILRRRLAERTGRTGKSAKAGSATSATGTAGAGAQAPAAELHQVVRDRLKALDPDADPTHEKAAKVFLESVLLWEFGDELANDPRFSEVISEVMTTILSDSRTGNDFLRLLKQLAA